MNVCENESPPLHREPLCSLYTWSQGDKEVMGRQRGGQGSEVGAKKYKGTRGQRRQGGQGDKGDKGTRR